MQLLKPTTQCGTRGPPSLWYIAETTEVSCIPKSVPVTFTLLLTVSVSFAEVVPTFSPTVVWDEHAMMATAENRLAILET